MPAPTLFDYTDHTPYSDPGRHASYLAELPTSPESLHQFACGTIVHYRADGAELTPEQRNDPDLRRISAILDTAEKRAPLDGPRAVEQKVAGCCRDHSLLTVSVLRTQGIPARTRIGFAGYFDEGRWSDHVVVERYDDGRWVRSDPELAQADFDFDVHDMPIGPESPFLTAAETWLALRSGQLAEDTVNVPPAGAAGVVLTPRDFARDYVLLEVAHRHRDELLLWDLWGPMLSLLDLQEQARTLLAGDPLERFAEAGIRGADMPPHEYDAVADELAHLLLAADAGDAEAADQLAEIYRADVRLHPGNRVVTGSPTGFTGLTDLAAR
ncbi:transglutaminase-like domain-containing protein [Myceligenerans crystallogenes]|uniref:transglutaminase-like domain-containing protein n=1 Tax=Myceligenerans crystallogenes TaxID=316335 RepID=UPI0031D2E85C